jgi:hypothetical protein
MLSIHSTSWLRISTRVSRTAALRGIHGSQLSSHNAASRSPWNSNPFQTHIPLRSSITPLHPSSSTLSVTIMGAPSRQHSGPGGHHHHNHDNTYLVSKNKNDAGVRITRIGLYVNLVMAIAKGVGGYVFHSQCQSIASVS